MTRRTRQHGLSYTPEYRVWQTMRLRCIEPSNAAYPSYGGRGITVCAGWLDDPQVFVSDMGRKPTPKHEIDRADNDGGYWCGKPGTRLCDAPKGPTGKRTCSAPLCDA